METRAKRASANKVQRKRGKRDYPERKRQGNKRLERINKDKMDVANKTMERINKAME